MTFLDLVKNRHSVRMYTDRPIENEKKNYLLECVRLAPSAVNFQPWRFIWIEQPEALLALSKAYDRDWFRTAPVVVVACANHGESWKRRSDGKDHADVDVAIAVEHLCLAAAEQGLGTCWVCNFDAALCREILDLPSDLEPIALVPIGYAASTEVPEKKRKAMEEILM